MNKSEVTNVVNILIEKELSYSQGVETIETVLNQLKDYKIQNTNKESTELGNKPEVKNIVNINLDTKEIRKETILSKVQNTIKKLDLSQVSVKDLADELAERKNCVTELRTEPYEKYSISMEYNGTITDLGPATILVIID
ncbi:BC1881 family protein [Clostridium botulinum]|uniref:BC1881 family protein n=1 Tax=Clostridium botulinum TaxID=1491 RepID=UPI0007738EC4|nr:BC1881 family protein [Clostridium botulinum]